MTDCKTEVMKALEPVLVTFLDGTTASQVVEEVVKVLANYDVQKKCTDLVVYDNLNEKLLNRYCACLVIDGKSEKTIYQYKRTMTRFARITKKLYTEVGPYDIRLFLAVEKERGISNITLENTRAHISAFFQWLTVEDVIPKNPCAAIKPVKYKETIKREFSAVEIDALRSACKKPRDRAIIEVLLSSGIRVSELADLRIDDIDFSSLAVHVRNGKGAKERTTYINNVAKTHLLKYLSSRSENTDALFCNGRHQPIAPGGIRAVLNKIAADAGVEHVHPHRFRRTFATNLANRGMSVQEICKLLGHSSISTTMVYVALDDERVHASYRRFMA